MDQRGTADLAQFPQPPSNSGPQEMERIAGSVRGHLLLCPSPPPGTSLSPLHSASLTSLSIFRLLLPSVSGGWLG